MNDPMIDWEVIERHLWCQLHDYDWFEDEGQIHDGETADCIRDQMFAELMRWA